MIFNNLITVFLKTMAYSSIKRFMHNQILLIISIAIISIANISYGNAQNSNLNHQVNLLKQDIKDIQLYIFQGKKPNRLPNSNQSLENSKISGQLQAKMQQIKQNLRKINGNFEETNHKISTMQARLDRLITDIDYRLRIIEGQLTGSPIPAINTQQPLATNNLNNQRTTTIINSQDDIIANGAKLSNGQQVLGQLTTEQMAAFKNGETQKTQQIITTIKKTTPPPLLKTAPSPNVVTSVSTQSPDSKLTIGASIEEQYSNAVSFLSKRDFDSAEIALTKFLDKNNDSDLAGNAIYWLGETYYARARFHEAAKIFAKSYSTYPKGAKVTDSLLKLAMSLEAIEQIEVACTSYNTLINDYKDARQRILSIAKKAVVKLKCQ